MRRENRIGVGRGAGTQSISNRGNSKVKAWVNMKYLDFLGSFLDLKEESSFRNLPILPASAQLLVEPRPAGMLGARCGLDGEPPAMGLVCFGWGPAAAIHSSAFLGCQEAPRHV